MAKPDRPAKHREGGAQDAPPRGGAEPPPGAGPQHEAQARARRLRGRNLAVLFALLAFIVLIYLVTLVRLGGQS
jgi:hypothetical protein